MLPLGNVCYTALDTLAVTLFCLNCVPIGSSLYSPTIITHTDSFEKYIIPPQRQMDTGWRTEHPVPHAYLWSVFSPCLLPMLLLSVFQDEAPHVLGCPCHLSHLDSGRIGFSVTSKPTINIRSVSRVTSSGYFK